MFARLRRSPALGRAVGGAAGATLAAAMATGISVQVGLVDTSRVRWVHHALYGVTLASGALAALVGRTRSNRLAREVALVPLVALARTQGGTRAHAIAASAAAAVTGLELVRSR